jgi:hypothetical protein
LHADADRTRARGGTRNLEAYEFLLKGRALQKKRGRFLPEAIACLAWSLAKAGEAERARAVHDEMMARSRHEFMAPFWLAASAASVGLEDEATRQLERAVREHGYPHPIKGRSRVCRATVHR